MATDPQSSHYDLTIDGHNCEVGDVQKAFLESWQGSPYVGHCLATALKYIFRCGKKDNFLRDMGKALVYLVWAVAAASGGKLPINVMESIDKYAPDMPADIFPPVTEKPACKDGFCPMPNIQLYAGTAD